MTFLEKIDSTPKFSILFFFILFASITFYHTWSYQIFKKPYYNCKNLTTGVNLKLINKNQYQRIILNENENYSCIKHEYTEEYVDILKQTH